MSEIQVKPHLHDDAYSAGRCDVSSYTCRSVNPRIRITRIVVIERVEYLPRGMPASLLSVNLKFLSSDRSATHQPGPVRTPSPEVAELVWRRHRNAVTSNQALVDGLSIAPLAIRSGTWL